MDWLSSINAAAIVAAVLISAYQTWRAARDARKRDNDRRTERALELYRDLVVEGDTAAAFHRLSVLLRRTGSARFEGTTWVMLKDDDFDAGGLLDPNAEGTDTPFEDLYRVLWFFERVHTSMHEGLVDETVLMRTIGFHCWWWGNLLHHVTAPKATLALRGIAPRATQWAGSEGVLADWTQRCSTDFDGNGPVVGVAA